MAGPQEKNTHKVEFTLSPLQAKTLDEIKPLLRNANGNLNEIAKQVFIQFLIQSKQQLVAQELKE